MHSFHLGTCSNGVQSCANEICTCNNGYIGRDCCQCDEFFYKVGDQCLGEERRIEEFSSK